MEIKRFGLGLDRIDKWLEFEKQTCDRRR